MTRFERLMPDCASGARERTSVIAPSAIPAAGAAGQDSRTDDAIRRELARLTALLRRHFTQCGTDSLLPALADTSDAAAAAGARHFLEQIGGLAHSLEPNAARLAGSPPTAGALADFQRETLALLRGVEQRLHSV